MATLVNELPAVDPDTGRVNVVVDTPQGRNKYKFDEQHAQWRLSKVFVSYNQMEGRQFKPLARRGPTAPRSSWNEPPGAPALGAMVRGALEAGATNKGASGGSQVE
jgi:hypothetical protein